MTENLTNSPEIVDLRKIEATANYEGNDTLLLIERVKSPIIREQIIDLLRRSELDYLSPEAQRQIDKDGGEIITWPDGAVGLVPRGFVPRTYLELKRSLEQRIEEVSVATKITFGNTAPNPERIPINWEMPFQGVLTTKQKSIAEAHEKGHVLRPYNTHYIEGLFSKAFDPSRVTYTEEDFANLKERNPGIEDLSLNMAKESLLNYLFSGMEIAERMSQLKNYFGLKGDEKFTKEHLDYARKHYVSDTGMDNKMTHFFQAVAPDTEIEFLRLINSVGI